MSANVRADASALAARYARFFGVSVDDVSIELREDDDAEVYVRVVGIVWTLSGAPLKAS